MQNLDDIFNAMHGLNEDELIKLNRFACNLIKDRQRMNTYKFNIGDKVSFIGRRGIKWSGYVSKILSRNIQVTCDTPMCQKWTVTSTMLTKI